MIHVSAYRGQAMSYAQGAVRLVSLGFGAVPASAASLRSSGPSSMLSAGSGTVYVFSCLLPNLQACNAYSRAKPQCIIIVLASC